MTTKIQLQPGVHRVQVRDGTKYDADTNGQISVQDKHVGEIVSMGGIVAGNVGPTAGRPPTAGPGTLYFDTTLNKPVWRNAAATGWVDATGTGA
jgi:hypothetical protein